MDLRCDACEELPGIREIVSNAGQCVVSGNVKPAALTRGTYEELPGLREILCCSHLRWATRCKTQYPAKYIDAERHSKKYLASGRLLRVFPALVNAL